MLQQDVEINPSKKSKVIGKNLSTGSTGLRLKRGVAIFLATAFFWPAVWLRATPTTDLQAVKAVENWIGMSAVPLDTPLGHITDEATTYYDDAANPIFHVVTLLPDGFVIVAADDLVEPIIGFLPAGTFDPSLDNPLGALAHQDLSGRIAMARKVEEEALRNGTQLRPAGVMGNAYKKWQVLSSDFSERTTVYGISSVSDMRVAPLLATTWDQRTSCNQFIYNYYTPNNYYSGCVATAQAQLMRYHSYPTTGPGTGSYVILTNGSPMFRSLLGGNGAGGQYNWGSMVLSPDCSTTLAQRQAIGALTHDAGVSVGMNYTSGGSEADTLATADSLVDTFGYSQAIKGWNAYNTIPVAILAKMINPNLDAEYPVLLGITGAGGHAIVVDGYGYTSSTLYHHLNMGWAGYDNGWYNLPTIDTAQYTFNSVYKCVYNIFTSGSGEIISGRVLDNAGSPLKGAIVKATRTGGGSYTATTNAKGIYALKKIPSSSTYILSVSMEGYTFAGKSITSGHSSQYSTTTGNLWDVSFNATVKLSSNITLLPILNLLLDQN